MSSQSFPQDPEVMCDCGCDDCCEGVETDCCPDDTVPEELSVEITTAGGCTCTTSTGTITWNGVKWIGDITLAGCGGNAEISLECGGAFGAGNWGIQLEDCDSQSGIATADCEPFEASVLLAADLCCGGSGTFTITITE